MLFAPWSIKKILRLIILDQNIMDNILNKLKKRINGSLQLAKLVRD